MVPLCVVFVLAATSDAPVVPAEARAPLDRTRAGVGGGDRPGVKATLAVEPVVERSTAVFIAPLIPVTGAAWAPASHSKPIVFVLAGANFMTDDVEWAFDLAFMQRDPDQTFGTVGLSGSPAAIALRGFTGGWLGFGPMFHTGSRALSGFFFNPKLTLGVFFIGGPDTIVDTMIGADVGYQFTVGRFYLAFVLGASVGLGVGDNDIWAGPLTSVPFSFVASNHPSLAVGLNLQLLRAGFTF